MKPATSNEVGPSIVTFKDPAYIVANENDVVGSGKASFSSPLMTNVITYL